MENSSLLSEYVSSSCEFSLDERRNSQRVHRADCEAGSLTVQYDQFWCEADLSKASIAHRFYFKRQVAARISNEEAPHWPGFLPDRCSSAMIDSAKEALEMRKKVSRELDEYDERIKKNRRPR